MDLAEAPERRGSLADLTDEEAGELVTAYAKAVVNREVVAGERVRKACARHLADLIHGHERGLRWDPVAAGFAIRFFPMVLRHYKGQWGPSPGVRAEGLPVELEPWQCFIIGSIMGWYRLQADGRWARRFRKALVEVAKKNGKTLLFAGLGILLAFFDGEPGAEVYSAATKKDQAKLLWLDGREMVRRSPALQRRIGSSATTLYDEKSASKFAPLSSEVRGEEGINPYACLMDELHRASDRNLLDMLGESGGARQWSFLGMITTCGELGPSIWQEEHEYAERVLDGIVLDDGEFAYIAMLDPGDKYTDERVWPKANPNLGVSVSVDDLRRAVQEAQEKPGKLPAVLRLRFNLRVQSAVRAVVYADFEACNAQPIAKPGAESWLGLDLGWTRDLSSAVLFTPTQDGLYDVRPTIWCPEEALERAVKLHRLPYDQWRDKGLLTVTEGNVRDDDAVFQDVLKLTEEWSVREVRYDRAMSASIIRRLSERGIACEPVQQTFTGIGPAWKEFERLYLAHRLRHGGHEVLLWMAGNLELKTDDNGNGRPTKPNPNSPLRIDAMSALLDAIAGYLASENEEEFVSKYGEGDEPVSLLL